MLVLLAVYVRVSIVYCAACVWCLLLFVCLYVNVCVRVVVCLCAGAKRSRVILNLMAKKFKV